MNIFNDICLSLSHSSEFFSTLHVTHIPCPRFPVAPPLIPFYVKYWHLQFSYWKWTLEKCFLYTHLGGKTVIEVSTDGWWINGWIIATFWVFLSSQPAFVGRGVSNVFSERPVDSAVFQEQTHNWINGPPGFVIDHIYTWIWCSLWEWSDKDGLRFVQLWVPLLISAIPSSVLSSRQ